MLQICVCCVAQLTGTFEVPTTKARVSWMSLNLSFFFGLFKPKITFTDKQMQIKTYLVSLGKLRSFLNCFCALIANRCYNFTSTAFIIFLYLCLHIAESILESIRLLHWTSKVYETLVNVIRETFYLFFIFISTPVAAF